VGKIGAAIVIFAYVVGLFVLVRPGSQGPAFVKNIGSGVAGVVKAGTGGGTWASG
jgi:hypothetical protein